MKKELCEVYDHLKAITGTSYGIISKEDLEMICSRYGLSSDEKAELLLLLHRKDADLPTAIEKATLLDELRKKYEPEEVQKPDAESAKKIVPLSDEQIIEKAVNLQSHEDFMPEMVMVLKEALCNTEMSKVAFSSQKIIARAMVDLGCARTRQNMADAGDRGWICGTYTSQIRGNLQWFLLNIYSLERLDLLLAYCKGNGHDDPLMDAMLICLASEIPRIHANLHSMKSLYS